MSTIKRFLKSDDGTTAVEYAVMLALIIGFCIGAIRSVGAGSGGMWGNNVSKLNAAGF